VKLKVLYFASVKERLGKGAEELDVPADVATVAGLRAHLGARGGAYAEVFGEKKLVKAAVNQDMVPFSAPLSAGDEVAFFPPVTGG
jgi:molybdopterin synthase sulfur carrier subunit